MEQLERLTTRLDNVKAVQPMLHALRAISSSTRLLALNRMRHCAEFRDGLGHMATLVQSHLGNPLRPSPARFSPPRTELLVVVGSERGLCGAFNDTATGLAERLFGERVTSDTAVELMAFGSRMQRALERRGLKPLRSERLSATGLSAYRVAERLSDEWLTRYHEQGLGAVDVVYNSYRGLASYEARTARLLPPEIPPAAAADASYAPWVQTDPRALYRRVVRLWVAASLHGILLESAAAEHSARYRLLDGAAQNAERLIEELTLYLQTARQEAITTELQDLASGAGLLGQPPA